MRQEGLRGAVGQRPTGRLAPPARADPAGLQQHVDRALGGGHATDILDLGAGHRLVIGDDGERLDRGARELAGLDRLLAEEPGEIAGGPKSPLARDPHQIDTARGIVRLQTPERGLDVDTGRQTGGEVLLVERLGRGKQHRLQQAKFLGARLRRPLRFVIRHDRLSLGETHGFAPPLALVLTRLDGRPTVAIAVLGGRALAHIDRRKRRVLVHLHHTLAHHLERGG